MRIIDLCNRNGINPCGGGTCKINENPPYFTCVCPRSSVQVNNSFCATPKYCDAQFPCPPESYCKNGNCECNPGYQWLSLPPLPLYDASVLRNRQSCK
uniref:Uncharacterized protein n=1 Tax=Romanomermis culicivorax TaxID=13658 RepID=A0A915J0W7_ROMCU